MRKLDGFALVTGGARGLGEAICTRLAQDGYDVVVNFVSDSSRERAQALADKLASENGVKTVAIQANVAKHEECERLLKESFAALGDNIGVLVNNAGIDIGKMFIDESVEEYERMISTNLVSVIHMSHLTVPYMIKQGFGTIVSLASIAGLVGWESQVDYSAAKAGVIGLTKGLAKEMGVYGITVNAVAPGAIWTDMVAAQPEEAIEATKQMAALKCLGKPEDIGDAVSYLVGAPFVTGQVLSPNGGAVM